MMQDEKQEVEDLYKAYKEQNLISNAKTGFATMPLN